jgi:hypothetical protein
VSRELLEYEVRDVVAGGVEINVNETLEVDSLG